MPADFRITNFAPAHIFRAVGKEVRRAAKAVARRLEISGHVDGACAEISESGTPILLHEVLLGENAALLAESRCERPHRRVIELASRRWRGGDASRLDLRTGCQPAIQTMRLILSLRWGFAVKSVWSGVVPATHIKVMEPSGALSSVSSEPGASRRTTRPRGPNPRGR